MEFETGACWEVHARRPPSWQLGVLMFIPISCSEGRQQASVCSDGDHWDTGAATASACMHVQPDVFETHSNAPTGGSIMLAGNSLKLGSA